MIKSPIIINEFALVCLKTTSNQQLIYTVYMSCYTFSHIKILIHAKINRDMNMMLTLICINCFVYNVNKVHNGRSRYINITGLWLHPLHEYELFIFTCIILHNQIRNFISIIGAHAWAHKNPSTIYISNAKTHSWEKAQNL